SFSLDSPFFPARRSSDLGVYGLYVAFLSKNNVASYSTLRNIFFMLQRVTGVITLIFVAWHVWETRIQKSLQGMSSEELAEYMHRSEEHTSELQSRENLVC